MATTQIETKLLKLIQQFLTELSNGRARFAVTLTASLDRDLGLGSLERAELFNRIDKTFGVQLSDSVMIEAQTVKDLVQAIENSRATGTIFNQEIHEPLASSTSDPASGKTLVEVLTLYSKNEPDRPHIFLQDDQGQEKVIRYSELLARATAVAHGLIAHGLKPQETVAIMLPTSEEFFYAFFGVLIAGGVPVPIYPPFRPNQIEEYAKREAIILRNAEVRILITFRRAENLSKLLSSFIPSLKEVVTVTILSTSRARKPLDVILSPDDAALIQYTSGSTGNPKGVLLTHHNLLTNIRAYGKAIGIQPDDVVVSWLPLYHDMGLIGTWLGSLYHGVPTVIMSPLTFLNRPERWLWTIHYHRGTVSAGPNFAYELCVRKIDETDIEGLDLSSWRFALNGAEAIYPKTLSSFIKKFEAYGFKPGSLAPAYGLAESSVGLVFPPLNRPPHIDRIARVPFEEEGVVVPYDNSHRQALEFVSCGKAMPNHRIRIVDDQQNELPERRVGNLQFTGPSSMQGYYRNPVATAAIYHDGWWDTGDLAYIADGELYVTGRKKDVIIKAGRNLYPAELEEIAGQVTDVRKGCVVALGIKDQTRGTEKLVIVAETNQTESAKRDKIIADITEAVTKAIGLPPDQVILAAPRSILKTSSGKLRRSATQEAYVKGKLAKSKPPWLQITKLFLQSQTKKLLHVFRWLIRFAYTAYLVLVAMLVILPFYASILLAALPMARKLTRWWMRVLIALSGCPLKVIGKEHLMQPTPMIYVSNHTSYLDSIVLLSILPAGTVFIGKQELLDSFLLRIVINKLQYIMINRLDFAQSLSETVKIENSLKMQQSLLIYPEGTFTYADGLRTFKLGAFKIAAETGTAICPIALKGTRKILRGDNRLLSPGKIMVTISSPLAPVSKEWNEAIQLRDKAREVIALHCGEPKLDLIRAGIDPAL